MSFTDQIYNQLDLLGEYSHIDGGIEKERALNRWFDFLLENKTHTKDLRDTIESRLVQLTRSDYKFRAYHYLHHLCDVKFGSFYDEEYDICYEYFYDRFGEKHIVTY